MAESAEPLDDFLSRARAGDAQAIEELLAHHRARLRGMIALRMDGRLAARFDPSDVVQEALVDAHHQLGQYLQEQTIPFYPWLRQIALNRLVDLYRRHLKARKRSVLK